MRLEAEFKARPGEVEYKGQFKQCAVCFCLQVASCAVGCYRVSYGCRTDWPSRPQGLLRIRRPMRRPSRPLSLLRHRTILIFEENIIWDHLGSCVFFDGSQWIPAVFWVLGSGSQHISGFGMMIPVGSWATATPDLRAKVDTGV